MVSRAICILILCLACVQPEPSKDPPASEIFGPLGSRIPRVDSRWDEIFELGQTLALKQFTFEEGLGPKFNVTSCAGCHETPRPGGGGPLYRNFHLMGQITDFNAFLLSGSKSGVYTFHHKDDIETEVESRKTSNVVAIRNPIPFFGLGLLELVDDETILEWADPDDADGDGISGRANFITGRVGRLGMKAQALNIEGFVRGPLMNHLGITSNPLSETLRAQLPFKNPPPHSTTQHRQFNQARFAQVAAPNEPLIDDDEIPDPEITPTQLFNLVSWASLLAAPRPEPLTPTGHLGLTYFREWGCGACHREQMKSRIGNLPLYSDLLLHDMGERLADRVEMGFASGQEFRTPPLWGIIATGPYLHDGRAHTLREAIEWHAGEAASSQALFAEAPVDAQDALIEFLSSLGGRDVASLGLIPPDSTAPASDQLGGPIPQLTASTLEQWTRGRLLFDKNFGYTEGLGPNFNGDSCRACHFLGAVGGAGPLDVDVHRLHTEGDQTLVRHEHRMEPALPSVIANDTILERRNTPPLFGIGHFQRVPDELIISFADPLDLDGDGVRGEVFYDSQGRVGRFGWRADFSILGDFVQDAFVNELGLTPSDDFETTPLGNMTSADVTAFIANLNAPTATPHMEGELLFKSIGCTACHRDDLPISNASQPLTNLLLHDIGTGHHEAGDPRNLYRTAPLWGLSFSAPYLHDGRAASIRDAILEHGGEATNSRIGFSALSASDAEKLIEFLELR